VDKPSTDIAFARRPRNSARRLNRTQKDIL